MLPEPIAPCALLGYGKGAGRLSSGESGERAIKYEELSGIGQITTQDNETLARVAYSIVVNRNRMTYRGAIIVIEGQKDLTGHEQLVLHLAGGRQAAFGIVSGDPDVGDYAIQVSRLDGAP